MPRLTRSDGAETHRVERNKSAPPLVDRSGKQRAARV